MPESSKAHPLSLQSLVSIRRVHLLKILTRPSEAFACSFHGLHNIGFEDVELSLIAFNRPIDPPSRSQCNRSTSLRRTGVASGIRFRAVCGEGHRVTPRLGAGLSPQLMRLQRPAPKVDRFVIQNYGFTRSHRVGQIKLWSLITRL